jgi:hypothetical protein
VAVIVAATAMNNGLKLRGKRTCGKAPWSQSSTSLVEVQAVSYRGRRTRPVLNHDEKKPLIAAALKTTFQREEPMKSVEGTGANWVGQLSFSARGWLADVDA